MIGLPIKDAIAEKPLGPDSKWRVVNPLGNMKQLAICDTEAEARKVQQALRQFAYNLEAKLNK